MEQAPLATPSRTALPRPQAKLPLLRPAATSAIPRPPSPEKKTIPLTQTAKRQSILPTPQSAQAAKRQSILPTPRTNASTTISQPSNARPKPRESILPAPKRSPLKPTTRPQQRHDSAIGLSFDEHVRKGVRHPSQQENDISFLDSAEDSDASTGRSGSTTSSGLYASKYASKRPPRPSLSDRTLESLASLPNSPAVALNRSSFFNAQSPVVTPRPTPWPTPRPNPRATPRPGSTNGVPQMPKLCATTGKVNGFARPQSPIKRPVTSAATSTVPTTPARRVVSSALPRTGGPGQSSTQKRKDSTPRTAVKSSVASTATRTVSKPSGPGQITNSKLRPAPMLGTARRTSNIGQLRSPLKANHATAIIQRPVSQSSTASSIPEEEMGVETPKQADRGSAGLRAQIAAAKAAAKATSRNASPDAHQFEDCKNPFNQVVAEQGSLAKRIDAARRDGRLNIAALELKHMPSEVLIMYDAEAMETSSISWNETVDLCRLNAADNVIESFDDNIFPDASPDELAAAWEAKGNQFGGLEALDLHGNVLRAMPMGLRRLERLTSLNLSRNKFDNSIFEVVTQITSLRELRLAENELTKDVPDCVGRLENLEVLDLQNNKLTTLPGSVRDLVNLRVLNVSRNRFAELPIGSIVSLPLLKEVYASSNALTGAFFPMTVDIVRSLETLDISDNSLVSISFGTELHLPAIQYLNISRNRLFALLNMTSWTKLITLLAEENGLTALPEGMTTLKKLKVADFQRNSLRSIEPEIANMDALETLGIAANPIRDKKLLGMSTYDIKEDMARKLIAAANEIF